VNNTALFEGQVSVTNLRRSWTRLILSYLWTFCCRG